MSLKQTHWRPVPCWLDKLKLSTPAALGSLDFPLLDILDRSVYYPASGFDGRPVQFLAGFVHSFIYVDYGHSKSELDHELIEYGFRGYRLSGQKHLQEKDLAPRGWNLSVPTRFSDQIRRIEARADFIRSPFATWFLFDREPEFDDAHGPQRFSLVYICADGVAAYQALYVNNAKAPLVLVIIQPGTGFGGNYTDFRDPRGLFAHVVLEQQPEIIPPLMVCGGLLLGYYEAWWPDIYPSLVEYFQHLGGNGVWGRSEPFRPNLPETTGRSP